MSHIEFSKAKHIKDLIIEHNLTHIILETGEYNTFIPEENKFVVKEELTKNTINLFNFLEDVQLIDLSKLKFENIETMAGWFYCCKTLKEVIFPNHVKAFRLKNMTICFAESGIEEIDLRNFYVPKLTKLTRLFTGCENLQKVYLPNLSINSEQIKLNNLVCNCTNLQELHFGELTINDSVYINGWFDYCSSLNLINCTNIKATYQQLKNLFKSETNLPQNCFIVLPKG